MAHRNGQLFGWPIPLKPGGTPGEEEEEGLSLSTSSSVVQSKGGWMGDMSDYWTLRFREGLTSSHSETEV